MTDDLSLHLRFLDRAVRLHLRTPDAPELRERIGRTLAGFARPDDGVPAESWTVTREVDGFRLHAGPEGAAGGGAPTPLADVRSLLHEVEWRVSRRLLPVGAPHLPLHASGFLLAGRPMLAVGASGCGKSTLAFEAWCAGEKVLGDDVVLIDEGSGLHGFPRLMKVPLAALARHDRPLPEADWVDRGNEEAWFDPGRSRVATTPAPALLVFPRWAAGTEAVLERIDAASRVDRLLRAVQGHGEAAPRLSVLLDRLSDTPAIELPFGDAGAALALLRERIQDLPGGSDAILKEG